MENKTIIKTQKYYLFLKEMNRLHNMGRNVVTHSDFKINLAKNLNLWENLEKQRKKDDIRAFIDGTLSELFLSGYIKRVETAEYRITDTGKEFLDELRETLRESFFFEFPSIDKELLEEKANEAIVVNKQFEYSPIDDQILTDDDIAELALEDYREVYQNYYI
ncbi:DNA-binding PadR family transcriptional regulator [Bacillus ectoiniformans]|uniref:hypothetical protein n=1 Tax=Bacillus ectoiniformans TaxID=1494429 RepID=UPI0019599121|nr:hypothetical protein [Bacillus ectoiniformans]MBM7648443.1 DNA-binding PadR family transcriptional regulator [Bacillus ectoiniformans]